MSDRHFKASILVRSRAVAACSVLLVCGSAAAAEGQVRFNRDVRPILAESCCACHGPDSTTREAELRLDDPKDVLKPRDGYSILVPGKPEESELFRRIVAEDESERMPPAGHGEALDPKQVDVIRRWIKQGGEYEKHWSFLPPECPDAPTVRDSGWVRTVVEVQP